jgi:hypothetical protein
MTPETPRETLHARALATYVHLGQESMAADALLAIRPLSFRSQVTRELRNHMAPSVLGAFFDCVIDRMEGDPCWR